MTLKLRQEKGTPLTINELDNNFLYLERLITNHIEKPNYIESIAKVEQTGSTINFIGTLGTELGSIKLPTIRPAIRGEWEPDIQYNNGDWVRFEAHIYVCITEHKSNNFITEHFTKLI